jgi:hypothetical protein
MVYALLQTNAIVEMVAPVALQTVDPQVFVQLRKTVTLELVMSQVLYVIVPLDLLDLIAIK